MYHILLEKIFVGPDICKMLFKFKFEPKTIRKNEAEISDFDIINLAQILQFS